MSFEKEIIKIKPQQYTAFTIGVFDGVHLGHQFLIRQLIEKSKANGFLSGVLTFKSHPQTVIDPHFKLDWLIDLQHRMSMLRELNVDIVIAIPFDHNLMKLEAKDFMELMVRHLKLKLLVVGPDFALGKDRRGNIENLQNIGKVLGFGVEVIPPFYVEGETVRSSVIRRLIHRGDVSKAAKMLGRPFSLTGEVIPGDRRGRELGFPTLNQEIKAGMASPANGSYATITHIDGKTFPSVTFIGTRPTFGGIKRLVETHIYDNTGPFKGKSMTVDFIERLREQEQFDNAEELKDAIRADILKAKQILSEV